MKMEYSSKEIKELSENMTNCPFCNGKKNKITTISKGAGKGSYYQGLCNRCWARGPKTSDPYSALDKWNNSYRTSYVKTSKCICEAQLNRLLTGRIAVRCFSQADYNILLNSLKTVCCNVNIEKDKMLWEDYREQTAVNLTNGEYFGYQSVEYFRSINITVENLIIK